MITNVYINEIIAGAQRAAADYAYRISRQSLTGENPDALWEKLDVCINGATCLINNEGLTDHENQVIIDKLLIRGGIVNYGTTPITFSSITVSPATTLGNLTGMVTSVGAVTTVVTNANLTGPIYSVGNATGITAQTGTTTVFAMQNAPTFTTNITTPLIIGGTAVGSKIEYRSTTGAGTTAGVAHSFTGGTNGATVAMTILNNGNTGIGTVSPTAKLHLKGIDTSSANSVALFVDSASAALFKVSNNGDTYLGNVNGRYTYINNGSILRFIQIGGVTPGIEMHTASDVSYMSSNDTDLTFYSDLGNLLPVLSIAKSVKRVNLFGGIASCPTSGTGVLSFLNTGTTPSTDVASCFQLYADDVTAGNTAPYFRTENGAIVKIYQETTSVTGATFVSNAGTAITSTDTFDGYTLAKIVKALRNQGLLQ